MQLKSPVGRILAIGLLFVTSSAQAAPLRHEEAVSGINNEQIITEVLVNDRPVTVSIDTGASANLLLFPAAVEKAGLKLVEAPRYGQEPGDAYFGKTTPATLQVGGRTIPNYEIEVCEGPSNGHDGFLGWSCLKANIWGFLFADKQLVTLEEVPADVLSWVHFDVLPQTPSVLCIAPRKGKVTDFRIMVDTGAGGGLMLPPKEWKQWKAQNPNQPLTLECLSVVGTIRQFLLEVGWAEEFRIGELTLRQIPVQEAPPGFYLENPGERTVGLGISGLKRMELVVDPGNKVAYANAITAAPGPFLHNRIGAVFVGNETKSDEVIAHVIPNSPAAKAGVQTGDRIISINGLTVDLIEHPELIGSSNEKAPAGTKFKVTGKRAGKSLNFEIIAEDILGPRQQKRSASAP